MSKVSMRGQEMPESPISKLVPLAAAAKERGTKVYHLNIGQPDLPTPQVGLDALKNIDRTLLEYSTPEGYLSYRKKLAGYYKKYDINVEPDDIVITCGGSEAVQIAFMACLDPGDEIILTEPLYANYLGFAIPAGIKVRTITTKIEDGFALPTVEKFEELINEKTKAILICNPNNPTGTVTDHDVVSAVISNNPDTLFIIDQSYSHYTLKRTLQPRECARQGNVLLLNSMTKDFGIPGLRLGFVTASRRLISLLRSHRMPWSVNSLAICAGMFLLKHHEDYSIDTAALCSERERVGRLIEELGIMTYPSDSNMLLCRLPESDAATLKEFLVASHSILIRDASNFETLTPQHFRIAVQTREENDKLIKSLEEWMKQ